MFVFVTISEMGFMSGSGLALQGMLTPLDSVGFVFVTLFSAYPDAIKISDILVLWVKQHKSYVLVKILMWTVLWQVRQ